MTPIETAKAALLDLIVAIDLSDMDVDLYAKKQLRNARKVLARLNAPKPAQSAYPDTKCPHGVAHGTPCNNCVICPNCVWQFPAIPVNVQNAPEPAAGVPEWRPIETAPKDNKRPLYLARFNEKGEIAQLDWDGAWENESESWELPQVYYFWASAMGIEEPTHWAFQDGPPPAAAPAPETK